MITLCIQETLGPRQSGRGSRGVTPYRWGAKQVLQSMLKGKELLSRVLGLGCGQFRWRRSDMIAQCSDDRLSCSFAFPPLMNQRKYLESSRNSVNHASIPVPFSEIAERREKSREPRVCTARKRPSGKDKTRKEVHGARRTRTKKISTIPFTDFCGKDGCGLPLSDGSTLSSQTFKTPNLPC